MEKSVARVESQVVYFCHMQKSERIKGATNLQLIIGVIVLGFIISGGAIAFGRMDDGQIDVSATISESNIAAGDDTSKQVEQPMRHEIASMPNGGLVGSGAPTPLPPPPPETEATTTASTTPESTTTESTTDESSEIENTEGELEGESTEPRSDAE